MYKLGQAVRAKVVEMSSKPHRFVLSLTGWSISHCVFIFPFCNIVGCSTFVFCITLNAKPECDALVPCVFQGVHKLETGSVALGIVTNIQPQGLMVKLPFGGVGTVAVTDLADAYRPTPLDGYSKEQLLRSVDAAVTLV